MAIVPLPLPPNTSQPELLYHLLEHGDIVGRDTAGRTIIQLSVTDHVLETLMTFDAEAAELEPEPDEDMARLSWSRSRGRRWWRDGGSQRSAGSTEPHGTQGNDPAQGAPPDRPEHSPGRRRTSSA